MWLSTRVEEEEREEDPPNLHRFPFLSLSNFQHFIRSCQKKTPKNLSLSLLSPAKKATPSIPPKSDFLLFFIYCIFLSIERANLQFHALSNADFWLEKERRKSISLPSFLSPFLICFLSSGARAVVAFFLSPAIQFTIQIHKDKEYINCLRQA